MYLRATVTYSDRFGSDKTASAVSAYRVEATTLFNDAPSFADQDDEEATPYIDVARSISENTPAGMNIGQPVAATDADNDILFYELLDTPDLEDQGGRARFTIDSASGQLRVGRALGADPGETGDEDSTTLDGGPALPSGEAADDAGDNKYVLRVRVSDPSTASDTVNVIVTVAEVNEEPSLQRGRTDGAESQGEGGPAGHQDRGRRHPGGCRYLHSEGRGRQRRPAPTAMTTPPTHTRCPAPTATFLPSTPRAS